MRESVETELVKLWTALMLLLSFKDFSVNLPRDLLLGRLYNDSGRAK